ncbi:MAG: F0F1 ATP synthase subunit A [Rhizobiaceae bacterium]
MNASSPLNSTPLFYAGPVPISAQVATTWAIMAILIAISAAVTHRLEERPNRVQLAVESIVLGICEQIRGVINRDPVPYLALLGTLFIYIASANLSAIIPGVHPPTASLETPAALAITVYFSVHYFGIRAHGLKRYLKGYLQPNPLLLPLNILSEVTRSFSLMVRLFGNMMSHEFVIMIVFALAGLLVPIPFLALAILIGLIQAYIFAILATVFIGGAVNADAT